MIDLQQQSAPAAPGSGLTRLYTDASGVLHLLQSNGTDTPLSTAFPAIGTALTPSGTVSANLFANTGFSNLWQNLTPGAGSGAYNATYALPTAGMVAGCGVDLNINLPASANPTVLINNATTGGTNLLTVTSPNAGAAVASFSARFIYNGTAWVLQNRGWQI